MAAVDLPICSGFFLFFAKCIWDGRNSLDIDLGPNRFGISYRWGILNLVVAFLVSINIWFYGNVTFQFAPYIRVIFVVTAIFWAVIQMYTFPFMLEQEEPLVKTALRNSLIAIARYPLRSIGILLMVVAIAFVSTYLYFILWVVISISLIAYLTNKNTLVVLEKLIAKDKEIQQRQNEE
jgi:type IV secretory pathway VirB3-like protein